MIKVLFFAALRERLGCSQISIENFNGSATELLQELQQRSPSWQSEFERQQVLCAINQELVPLSTSLKAGDEVALFPPVTGG